MVEQKDQEKVVNTSDAREEDRIMKVSVTPFCVWDKNNNSHHIGDEFNDNVIIQSQICYCDFILPQNGNESSRTDACSNKISHNCEVVKSIRDRGVSSLSTKASVDKLASDV